MYSIVKWPRGHPPDPPYRATMLQRRYPNVNDKYCAICSIKNKDLAIKNKI